MTKRSSHRYAPTMPLLHQAVVPPLQTEVQRGRPTAEMKIQNDKTRRFLLASFLAARVLLTRSTRSKAILMPRCPNENPKRQNKEKTAAAVFSLFCRFGFSFGHLGIRIAFDRVERVNNTLAARNEASRNLLVLSFWIFISAVGRPRCTSVCSGGTTAWCSSGMVGA